MTKRTYTREDYRAFAEEAQVDRFYEYISELEALIAEYGWELEQQPRSRWCAFKRDENGKVAFGIMFGNGNALFLYIKRVESEAKTFPIKLSKHNEEFDQCEYLLEPGARLKAFVLLLELAYRRSIE